MIVSMKKKSLIMILKIMMMRTTPQTDVGSTTAVRIHLPSLPSLPQSNRSVVPTNARAQLPIPIGKSCPMDRTCSKEAGKLTN